MDTLILAAGSKASSGSSSTYLLLIIVVFGGLMLFSFRSSRRRQQNAQNTQRQLVNGARVRTVHGIYGTVRDSDDQNVMVEVAPGVHIKMLKQAVGTVLPDDAPDGVLNTMPADAAGPDANDQKPENDDTPAGPPQNSSDLSR